MEQHIAGEGAAAGLTAERLADLEARAGWRQVERLVAAWHGAKHHAPLDLRAAVEEGIALLENLSREDVPALLAEVRRLQPYEAAIRAAHNGYAPDCRAAMPELREPATPADAIRELLEEERAPVQGEPGGATPRPVDFWTCKQYAEHVTHGSIEEAVEEFADERHPHPLPEEVTVYGFARTELPAAESLARRVLEDVLEGLDEEHGDPEEATEPNEAMKAAALAFAQAIRAEYRVWTCEPVTQQTVRVSEYLTQPYPEPGQ